LGASQWLLLESLPKQNQSFQISFNDIYRYVGGLFLANSLFAIMTQADVMLVKHYFSSQDAGFYASAAILGKAVMYLPGAIVMALFPMVAANQATGNSSHRMLAKAVGLTIALSGMGALILFLFPELIMGKLFGIRYLPATPIVARFGLAMLPMALVLLLMNFLLALGKTDFVVYMAMATVFEMIGIYFCRNHLQNILYIIMASGCFILIVLSISVYRHFDFKLN
jgi:O-antigen/teichoic acid export membrane protein